MNPSRLRFNLIPALLLGCLLLLTPTVRAEPPTDEEVQAKMMEAMNWFQEHGQGEPDMEAFGAFVTELMSDVDINELTLAQLETLGRLFGVVPALLEEAGARLAVLAEAPDADGAQAAIIAAQMAFEGPDMNDALRRVMRHPGLGEAMKSGQGAMVFQVLGYLDDETLNELSAEILGLQEFFSDEMPIELIASLGEYVTAVGKLEGVDKAEKTAIRDRVVGLITSALEQAKTDGNERATSYLTGQLKYLNGAAGRGELIDHPAPPVKLIWSSGEKKLANLNALKGRVVVLDFWATWCGPCVASIPNIQNLQKHYADYDVTILGVTSLQGEHFNGDGTSITTEGDPEKEFGLMREFVLAKGITWTIAFSEDEVFNPEFGVRGIPHVAIIDAKGVVRYNGLPPATPLSEKAHKIDELLKEAGLKAPPPVEEEEDEEEGEEGDDAEDAEDEHEHGGEHEGHDHEHDDG